MFVTYKEVTENSRLITKIDRMMEIYYIAMGCHEYDHKFSQYCNKNQINDELINTELIKKKYKKSMKCVLFDEKFPFCSSYDIETKNHKIFQLLSYCAQYKPSLPLSIIHGMLSAKQKNKIKNTKQMFVRFFKSYIHTKKCMFFLL